MTKLSKLWKESRLAIMLWLCRILAFIQVYGYHDWQSVPFLIWIFHSTLYRKSSRLSVAMMVFYLPCFTAIFLWYYTINIYGVVSWDDQEIQNTNYRYNMGYYQFNIPPLEVGFLFICLFCMIEFCRLLRVDLNEDKNNSYHTIKQMQNRRANVVDQLLFICLINIEYPLMLLLVTYGIGTMNLHHIMYFVFFMIYTLWPNLINRCSIVLLIYTNVFILAQYVYTLVIDSNERTTP